VGPWIVLLASATLIGIALALSLAVAGTTPALSGLPLGWLAVLSLFSAGLGLGVALWAMYRGSNPKPSPQVSRLEFWGFLLAIIGVLQGVNLFLYSQLYNWVVHLNSPIDQLYQLLK